MRIFTVITVLSKLLVLICGHSDRVIPAGGAALAISIVKNNEKRSGEIYSVSYSPSDKIHKAKPLVFDTSDQEKEVMLGFPTQQNYSPCIFVIAVNTSSLLMSQIPHASIL